jgi:hypothetical protein
MYVVTRFLKLFAYQKDSVATSSVVHLYVSRFMGMNSPKCPMEASVRGVEPSVSTTGDLID